MHCLQWAILARDPIKIFIVEVSLLLNSIEVHRSFAVYLVPHVWHRVIALSRRSDLIPPARSTRFQEPFSELWNPPDLTVYWRYQFQNSRTKPQGLNLIGFARLADMCGVSQVDVQIAEYLRKNDPPENHLRGSIDIYFSSEKWERRERREKMTSAFIAKALESLPHYLIH